MIIFTIMREVLEKVLTRLVLPTNDKLVYVSFEPMMAGTSRGDGR